MNIELLPNSQTSSSVKRKLKDAIVRSILLKGAVAFWTIPVDYISVLADKLSKNNSFMCVDFHYPTNIDSLTDFTQYGANMYLHDYQLTTSIYNENRQNALLHTKILHFEFENNTTETWIGSHNFTRSAIDGINFEASTIITTNKETKEEIEFIQKVTDYLELIKNSCIPFEPKDVDFYKALQGKNSTKDVFDVIEIVGRNIAGIPQDKTIQIISKDASNFEKYKLVNKKIILHCLDLDTQKEHIFQTVILNAGTIDTFNDKSYDITFSQRRFAIRERNMLPYLQSQNVVDANLLKISQYYINLDIDSELFNYKIYEKPSKKEEFWEYLDNSPHIERMEKRDIVNIFKSNLPFKKGKKNNPLLNKISLREIITEKGQKYLVANYEENKYFLKYKTEKEIDNEMKNKRLNDIPASIERKQLFVKRIVKKNNENE